MKRFLIISILVAMLLCLCACAGGGKEEPVSVSEPVETSVPEEPEETPVPEEPAAEEPSDEPTPRPEAVLSPGAAEDSQLSSQFAPAEDGTLYSSLVRGDGFTSIYDLLPDDVKYVAGFIMTDDGIYASVKETSFFMDPAVLCFFPADGSERKIITEELSPSGRFCMAGGELFFESLSEKGFLWHYDAESGDSVCVVPDALSLLSAKDGFIYYAKVDGIYRNDSTMDAEDLLFLGGVNALSATNGILCDLTFDQNRQALIEFRKENGDPLLRRPLDTVTDHFIAGDDNCLYVPQDQSLLVLSTDNGSDVRTIELPAYGSYCTLRYAGQNTIIYETLVDGNISIFRVSTDGTDSAQLDTSGILY